MRSVTILLILAGLVAATFGSVAGHGFINDDHILFLNNDFYNQPRNIRTLWTKAFITTPAQLGEATLFGPKRSVSGCVAFRPLTALSFFGDTFLWKGRPAGYHLSTLLIHLFVVWALWLLLVQLGLSRPSAGLAAALFAVHPVQAEVVNNIGYRSDLLVGLFSLLSLICWTRLGRCLCDGRSFRHGLFWTLTGLAAFAAALLSKEVAVGLPLLVLAYFLFLAPRSKSREIHRAKVNGLLAAFLGLGLVLGLYLYLYFIRFPGSTPVNWSNVGFGTQARQALRGLSFYLRACVWPWRLPLLPSFYAPSTDAVPWHEILVAGLAGSAALWTVIQGFRDREKYGTAAFFVVWFGVTYAPSANLWPLPSPLAYRYLYLPLAACCALMALAVEAGLRRARRSRRISPLSEILVRAGFVGLFAAASLPLNIYYRDDRTVNLAVIRDYPDSAYPYLLLGSDDHRQRRYPQAAAALRHYLTDRPDPDTSPYDLLPPRFAVYVQMGTCFIDDPDRALKYFSRALQLKPDYAPAYAQTAWALAQKKDYAAALHYCHKALKIDPDLFIGYFYALQLYNFIGDMDSFNVLLARAKQKFPLVPWDELFDRAKEVSEINVRGQRLRKL